MTNLNTIKMWKHHEFESASYRTEDYCKFEQTLVRWMRRLCKNNNWEVVKVMRNHFECGFFIRGRNGRMVNILGNDVRWNDWWNRLCYRFVKDENDYHGESNCWTSYDKLEGALQNKLN